MKTKTIKISEANHAWLRQRAAALGISIKQLVESIFAKAFKK